MAGRSSPSRWSAGRIIATHDAQPERKPRSHTTSGVSCAHCAELRRMPQSDLRMSSRRHACKGPSSVRVVTFAIIVAHISRRTRF
jgi:hypothetical protein